LLFPAAPWKKFADFGAPEPRASTVGADVEIPSLPEDRGMIEHVGVCRLPDGGGDATRLA
jgi:hypothetical protein